GESITVACYWGSRASSRFCTTAWPGAPHLIPVL
ncbi:hypothetical protein Gohar_008411, partial [Gossypium harknessii]|nr:hypothetical protein [Gossypium harknessii]